MICFCDQLVDDWTGYGSDKIRGMVHHQPVSPKQVWKRVEINIWKHQLMAIVQANDYDYDSAS